MTKQTTDKNPDIFSGVKNHYILYTIVRSLKKMYSAQ